MHLRRPTSSCSASSSRNPLHQQPGNESHTPQVTHRAFAAFNSRRPHYGSPGRQRGSGILEDGSSDTRDQSGSDISKDKAPYSSEVLPRDNTIIHAPLDSFRGHEDDAFVSMLRNRCSDFYLNQAPRSSRRSSKAVSLSPLHLIIWNSPRA